jgi:hypothetical protein
MRQREYKTKLIRQGKNANRRHKKENKRQNRKRKN